MLLDNQNPIKSKNDLLLLLKELQKDYEKDSNQWINQSIGAYLEAISAWIDDSNMTVKDDEDWTYIAAMFLAGKIYE